MINLILNYIINNKIWVFNPNIELTFLEELSTYILDDC